MTLLQRSNQEDTHGKQRKGVLELDHEGFHMPGLGALVLSSRPLGAVKGNFVDREMPVRLCFKQILVSRGEEDAEELRIEVAGSDPEC